VENQGARTLGAAREDRERQEVLLAWHLQSLDHHSLHIYSHQGSETSPEANLVPSFNNSDWCVPYPKHSFEAPSCSPNPLLLFLGLFLGCSSLFFDFTWLLSASFEGFWWVLSNWTLILPPLFWLGLLALGLAVQWLVPPEPEVQETRRQRRYREQMGKKLCPRLHYPGATRMGYHKSFPLRCLQSNLNLMLPHPRDRWKRLHIKSVLEPLLEQALLFASKLQLPARFSEGENEPVNNEKRTGASFSKKTEKNISEPTNKEANTGVGLSKKAKRVFGHLLDALRTSFKGSS
jgi:hypothetical protein